MNIKIESTGVDLDLPTNCELDATFTNPMFSDSGSQTLSVTLPPTPKNLNMLGHPERTDNFSEISKQQVVVEDGIYIKHGELAITEASKDDGVSSSILFDEGAFWNKINNTKVSDLDWEVIDYGSVAAAISACEQYMWYPDAYDYNCFPVCYEKKMKDTLSVCYCSNLFEIHTIAPEGASLNARSKVKEWVEGKEWALVTNPVGYAITPFIKVHVFLNKLFSLLGFTLSEDPFSQHHQLKKMVLLNNTRDAIVDGKLHLSQIVPDCSVNDFLDTLMANFGAATYFDTATQTVSIRLIKDIIPSEIQKDISQYRSSNFRNIFAAGKQLKLSAQKNITAEDYFITAGTDTDTFEEFATKYGTSFRIQGKLVIDDDVTHTYFARNTQSFYRLNLTTTGKTDKKILSSMYFDYDRKIKDNEYIELSGKNEQIPVRLRSELEILNHDGSIAIQGVNTLIPYYGIGARNKNTVLSIDSTKVSESSDNENDIAFCFAFSTSNSIYSFGSPFSYSNIGEDMYDSEGRLFDIDLCFYGNRGLYFHFFKHYEACLRHAFQKVKANFKLPDVEFNNLQIHKPIMVDNQSYLIEQYEKKIGKQVPGEFLLRALRLKSPYNLTIEQALIQMSAANAFYWDYFNNINEKAVEKMNAIGSGFLAKADFAIWYSVPWSNDAGIFYLPVYAVNPRINNVSAVTSPSGNIYPAILPTEVNFGDTIFVEDYQANVVVTYDLLIKAGNYYAYGHSAENNYPSIYISEQLVTTTTSGNHTQTTMNFTHGYDYQVGLVAKAL